MTILGLVAANFPALRIMLAIVTITGWGGISSAKAQDKPKSEPPNFDAPLKPPKLEPNPPDIAAKAAKFGPPRIVLEGLSNVARSVAISPDGKLLAAGSNGGTFKEKNLYGDIRLWDLPAGKERAAIRGHADTILALAFSPDSKHLVSATVAYEKGRTSSGEIKIWDVESLNEVRTLKGHRNLVYALAISNDGKQIVSASYGGTVILWDFATGRMLRTFKGTYSESFMCVAISPDGRKIAAGSMDDKLRIWDVPSDNDKPAVEINLPEGWKTAVAFSPDSKTLVSAGTDGRVRFWDVAKGKKIDEAYVGTAQNTFLAFTRDGRKLVAGGGKFGLTGRVVIFDYASRKPEHIAEWEDGIMWGLAVSPDNKTLATIAGKTIRLWEMPSGR